MCCINELLAKNCVPEEFEDYLLQMFQQCFYLLQRITRDTTTNVSGNRLADMNDRSVMSTVGISDMIAKGEFTAGLLEVSSCLCQFGPS